MSGRRLADEPVEDGNPGPIPHLRRRDHRPWCRSSAAGAGWRCSTAGVSSICGSRPALRPPATSAAAAARRRESGPEGECDALHPLPRCTTVARSNPRWLCPDDHGRMRQLRGKTARVPRSWKRHPRWLGPGVPAAHPPVVGLGADGHVRGAKPRGTETADCPVRAPNTRPLGNAPGAHRAGFGVELIAASLNVRVVTADTFKTEIAQASKPSTGMLSASKDPPDA